MNGILQTKNGKYYVVLDYRDSDGKRKRKWVSTGIPVAGNNVRAAKKALTETMSKYESLETCLKNDCLFTDYLADWLEKERNLIDIATWNSYKKVTERHIIPYFQPFGYTLTELNPQILQRYYDLKKESGRLDGKGGLSAKTVIQHHVVIHQTLKCALNELRIPYNPADRVRLPKKERFVGGFYTSEQIENLLACCSEEPLKSIIMFTAFFGLRRSEVIGLKWSAVDYERQTITICHTVVRIGEVIKKDKTKNETSRRSYPLTPKIIECLKMLEKRENENRRFFGREFDDNDYIFKREDGCLVTPDYVSRKFAKLIKDNNLPKIRFHDLRHSCASILIDMGFSLKDIQEWLGHADITMTGNVYGHLFKDRKKSLADQLEEKMSHAAN